MITHWEMILRITLAAFLGGVIGFERDIHRRQAGLRTHLIVAMASATFMVVSAHFMYFQRYVAGNLVTVDSSRIAASVVAGVGFLGGGSILRTGATVQGLTTAAGLWLVAALGLCAGSGMYPESVFVTVLGLLALTVLRVFEDKKVVPPEQHQQPDHYLFRPPLSGLSPPREARCGLRERRGRARGSGSRSVSAREGSSALRPQGSFPCTISRSTGTLATESDPGRSSDAAQARHRSWPRGSADAVRRCLGDNSSRRRSVPGNRTGAPL
jgi:uncharacterized membrane protein YhiD involved in acid resistance